MAIFETLFILAGLLMGLVSRGGMYLFLLPLAVVAFVLAIMNRPSPTGSRARKIVSSILSAAYLVTVIVCSLTFFKGGSNDSVNAPPRNAPVAVLHKLHNGTELGLHECTVAISGEIRMSPAKGGFYVCKDTSWQVIDLDTYGVLKIYPVHIMKYSLLSILQPAGAQIAACPYMTPHTALRECYAQRLFG